MAYVDPIKYWAIIVGISPLDTNYRILQKFMDLVAFIFSLWLIATIIFFVAAIPLLLEDIEKLFQSVTVLIIASIAWCKIYILKKNNLNYLLDDIIAAERKIDQSNEKVKNIFCKYSRINYLIAKAFIISIYVAAVVLVFDETVKMKAYNRSFRNMSVITNGYFYFPHRPILFQYAMPFDMDEHFTWTLLGQVLTCVSGITFLLTEVLLFIGFLIFVISQLEILQCFVERNEDYIRLIESNCKCNRNQATVIFLIEFVKEHNKIIKFVDYLSDSTKIVLALEFLGTILLIAVMLAQFQMVTLSTELYFNLIVLVAMLFQNFIICWLANEVKLQSILIGDYIFNHFQWYDLDDKVNFLLRMIILRCQKHLVLSIGPFGKMSIDTFIQMAKAAISTVTFLQNIRKS